MNKLITCLLILFISFSCTSYFKNEKTSNYQFDKYEYIIKDDSFIDEIQDSLPGDFLSLTNGFTYYELANPNNDGPTLVLVHGFSVPSYIWDLTFDKAKDLGYKVLRFDLFGRGYSQNLDTDYTDNLFAKQSWELIDSLSISNPVLIGLSNGGRVISKMAHIFPNRVDKLVYVSSNGFNNIKELMDKTVSDNEITNYIKNYDFLSKSQKNDFKNPEKFTNWDRKYSKLQKYRGFAKALISTRKNHISLDSIHIDLANTDIDIFTLWGEYDSVVIYKDFENKLNQILPNRKEFFFQSAGHLPQMESPNKFNTILFENILDFTK